MTRNNDPQAELKQVLASSGSWFCSESGGDCFELRRGEWEIRKSHERIFFSYWGESGHCLWRVKDWSWNGRKLAFELSRRTGSQYTTMELVPYAPVKAAVEAVADARRYACIRMAKLAASIMEGAKIERAALSQGPYRSEPGRYTRILLVRGLKHVAVTGPVPEDYSGSADAFLTSALLWFGRLKERRRPDKIPSELWLILPPALLYAVPERLALLSFGVKQAISAYTAEGHHVRKLASLEFDHVLRSGAGPVPKTVSRVPGIAAQDVIKFAPEAIDVLRARHGETLRLHGLSFARVRTLLDKELLWFGLDGKRRQLLHPGNILEFERLVRDLHCRRQAEPGDKDDALYRAAPEAWLESMLRRDIRKLDPGLIISPLHVQFRLARNQSAGSRPIDLLALRDDGRLVVIEVKVSEDGLLPLQGVEYWRRVESLRLKGHLARARLFGEKQILDQPPLLYLVAPMLRFHRNTARIASLIDHRIEIYRFEINENWRSGVRVTRRARIN